MDPEVKKLSRKRNRPFRKIIRRIVAILFIVLVIMLINPVLTLRTITKVDDYPLYTMHWQGGYALLCYAWEMIYPQAFPPSEQSTNTDKACALFAAFGDKTNCLYGRGFDWGYSPALLLYAKPSGKYATVTMVDLTHLGFDETYKTTGLSWWQKVRMLAGPLIPLEGINEHGLTAAVATLSSSEDRQENNKPLIHCLMALRYVLDRCKNTPEALTLLEQYDIGFPPVPGLHLLIADPGGHSAIVEWIGGQMHIIRNTKNWQVATNFSNVLCDQPDTITCNRYKLIMDTLDQHDGKLTADDALLLLQKVADHTPWSVVYNMSNKSVDLVMNKNFDKVYHFDFNSFN